MKKLLAFLFASYLLGGSCIAQMKAPKMNGSVHVPYEVEEVAPVVDVTAHVRPPQYMAVARSRWAMPQRAIASLPTTSTAFQLSRVMTDPLTGLPRWIEGRWPRVAAAAPEQMVRALLTEVAYLLQWPADGWQVGRVRTDELGYTHVRLQQVHGQIPVYGGELIVHVGSDGVPFLINGKYFKVSDQEIVPHIVRDQALQIAVAAVLDDEPLRLMSPQVARLAPGPQLSAALYWWAGVKGDRPAKLAWRVEVMPHLLSRQTLWVDAYTGQVLHRQEEVCSFLGPYSHHALPPDGPATANAYDLLGQIRTIHTYQLNGAYYLIDASRPMFNANASNLPDEPVGAIWTITANGTSPSSDDFYAAHLTTTDNQWGNPTAVSAHYNGGVAYEYYRSTFGRNSINGMGGTVISLIDVVDEDGQQMDNAFWNGQAMFYGNGNNAFVAPLAKALDVAGHEMTHGVIQAEANLEYYGESGAINESMADVFAVMIDRDDWKLGEDVVNTSYFPSGALRNMENPHNGGNSLNDNGWQPAHTDEQYFGNEDNGGVHINSGIPNRAFYIFAISVSKAKAEQVYYRALTQYLTKSSQFIDLRLAVVQAAADLYGSGSAEVQAAKNAFDVVGIEGDGSTTTGPGDLMPNPGDDFVMLSDADLSALYLFTPDGQAVANPLTTVAPLSKPSITDDGSVVVYIAEDQTMQAIVFDWQNGTFEQSVIQSDPIWRNVAIARDGSRLAALTDDYDNRVWVYDFGLEAWQTFTLYNPTTASGGVQTNDVQYADVLEFDFSGEWLMYDAFNRIEGNFGNDIEYWDIGFVRVWDGAINNWGDGFVDKLFNSLPDQSSVGNPTFAKNSEYIIAFDFLDEFEQQYYLLAANVEQGEVGTIYHNTTLSYPNYSVDDDFVVFDALTDPGNTPLLAMIPIGADKVSPAGDPFAFINQGKWGVWFATGQRVLTGTVSVAGPDNSVHLWPNPAQQRAYIQWQGEISSEELCVYVRDASGRVWWTTGWNPSVDLQIELPVGPWPKGVYRIEVLGKQRAVYRRLIKM